MCAVGLSSEGGIEVSMDVISETAPLPHTLTKEGSNVTSHIPSTTGTFPILNSALLKVSQFLMASV